MIQIQYIIFCCSIIRYEVFPDEKCSGMLIPDIKILRLKRQRSSAVQKTKNSWRNIIDDDLSTENEKGHLAEM